MRTAFHAQCLSLALLLGAVSVPVAADTLLVPDHPQQYVVRKGDTLWDIAAKFLTKPWRWPELWEINRHIENPHLIYPGDLLRVVHSGDQQYIELVRGGGSGLDDAAGGADSAGGADGAGGPDGADGAGGTGLDISRAGSREVKLTPQIKAFPRESGPITTVPLERVHAFLRHARVVGHAEYESWPYVLTSVKDGRFVPVMADETPTVYVRGDLDPRIRSYSVYRKNKDLRSPSDKDKIIGTELLYVGVFVLHELGPDITHRGKMEDIKLQLEQGDRLYPEGTADSKALSFVPQPPPKGIKAEIISILDGVLTVSENGVVAISVGEKDGMRPGMVLPLYSRNFELVDSVSASLRAKQEAAIPLKFRGEDSNVLVKMFSSTYNTVRDMKNKIDSTPLVEYLGTPQQSPDIVKVWPELNGNIIVFRTFEEVSYALVIELNRAAFSDDFVLTSDMLFSDTL